MYDNRAPSIGSPLIQAIEDAILFGNIKEIDGLMDIIREDEDFPVDLRYGLESMMYFRMFYGKGGRLEPVDEAEKSKINQLDSWWGRELIESIGHHPDLTEAKYA